jgi:spermidine synthase
VTGRSRSLLFVALCLAACVKQQSGPRVVFDGPSPINGRVIVTEKEGERVLRFSPDGARQSVIRVGAPLDLRLPYARSAMVSLGVVPAPKRTLIIGVGGGTMPMFLRTLYPDMEIDGVDIDPQVVDVARQHLGLKTDPRLHAIVADGRKYTETAAGQYDLIFLDAYNDEEPPRHLTTVNYLRTVRAKLSPGGLAVGNVWEASINPKYADMLRTWQEAFGSVCVLDVPEAQNEIFLAGPDGKAPSSDALLDGAKKYAAERALPFDLVEHARSGCQVREPGGQVLSD